MGTILVMIAAVTSLAVPAAAQQPAQQPAASTAPPPAAAPAEDSAPLPAADEVLARNIEARGGEAAMRRHQHCTWKGTFSMPGMGVQGNLTVQSSAPNFFKVTIEADGIGTIAQGYDGKVGWSDNPMTGPTLNSGKELELTAIQSDFYADLNTAQYFSKVETVGRETYAGEPCYKLAFTSKGGVELFSYYSVATGLLRGTSGNLPTPMGEVFVETETGEYKEFDGVRYPTHSVQKAMGAEQVLTLGDPDFSAIDPSVFALPEAVKTLAAAQPAQ
jgi:hypothetical protein